VVHPHIVQFLGKCSDEENCQYIVIEFMSKGALKDLLEKERSNLTFNDLLDMMIGACKGMVFLAGKKILHRDLGVRNLLVSIVDNKYVVKISDFGLSRVGDLQAKSDEMKNRVKGSETFSDNIYVLGEKAAVPVKWSAPEVLENHVYTHKSDVWSFGVVMWEILEFGRAPFDWLTLKQAWEQIPNGARLPQPNNCPKELWRIISSTWNMNQELRPNFIDILRQLQALNQSRNSPNEGKNVEEEPVNHYSGMESDRYTDKYSEGKVALTKKENANYSNINTEVQDIYGKQSSVTNDYPSFNKSDSQEDLYNTGPNRNPMPIPTRGSNYSQSEGDELYNNLDQKKTSESIYGQERKM